MAPFFRSTLQTRKILKSLRQCEEWCSLMVSKKREPCQKNDSFMRTILTQIPNLICVNLNASMRVRFFALTLFTQEASAACRKRLVLETIFAQMTTITLHYSLNMWLVRMRQLVRRKSLFLIMKERCWRGLSISGSTSSFKTMSVLTSFTVHGKWPSGTKCT